MADPRDIITRALADADRGRLRQAVGALERLSAKRGAPVEATHFLGLLLVRDGREDQGLFHLERASQAAPGRPQLESNFANVLVGLGRVEEGIARYEAALSTDQTYAPARVGLAGALLRTGEMHRATDQAERAWALAPNNPDGAANLASCLITTGRAREAVEHLRAAIRRVGPSIQLQTLLAAAMNYDDQTTPKDRFETHQTLGRLHQLAARELGTHPPVKTLDAGADSIRVGYLSGDFADHPVGMFIEPALANDPARTPAIEVFCYDVSARSDAWTERLRAHGATWRDARAVDDAHLVSMIREDGIDVLVELSGHSIGNRQTALAARAAPVQATMLGYPATTGNPAIDVRLVDAHADPEGADRWCTELLSRIEQCAWCFGRPEHAPEPSAPPSAVSGTVAFGSFNNLAKTTPSVVATWAALLERVPDSTLVLKNGAFIDGPTRDACAQRFVDLGVERGRIDARPPTDDAAGHLGAYAGVDVALDTFPYAGTTTTCEALWMGVPVVTLAGDSHASRVGVSLLHAVGLSDLVASDTDEYVTLGATLARDAERRSELRATLRERMLASPLMDPPGYRSRLHNAIEGVWRARAQGEH